MLYYNKLPRNNDYYDDCHGHSVCHGFKLHELDLELVNLPGHWHELVKS